MTKKRKKTNYNVSENAEMVSYDQSFEMMIQHFQHVQQTHPQESGNVKHLMSLLLKELKTFNLSSVFKTFLDAWTLAQTALDLTSAVLLLV